MFEASIASENSLFLNLAQVTEAVHFDGFYLRVITTDSNPSL